MWECSNCGRKNYDNRKICFYCRAEIGQIADTATIDVSDYIREKKEEIAQRAEEQREAEKRTILDQHHLFTIEMSQGKAIKQYPEISEQELEELKKLAQVDEKKKADPTESSTKKADPNESATKSDINLQANTVIMSESNTIASILKWIAIITFIGGFIAGIVLAAVDNQFSFGIAIIWAAAFISGSIFLGFSEIIQLLSDQRNKGFPINGSENQIKRNGY